MPFSRSSFRAVLTAMAVLLALPSTAAAAAETSSASSAAAPGLTPIRPGPKGYFYYTLAPGQSATAQAVVHDLSTSPARYLVYVTGATTSPVGGVSYGQPSAHPSGAAAWLRPSETTVDLGPKGAATVQARIVVPPGTLPGDYVAAIAAQDPTSQAEAAPAPGQRFGFVVTTRAVVAVVVRVPGPMAPAAGFGRPSVAAQQQRQVLTIPIHDTGNQLMKPYLVGKVSSCSTPQPLFSLARQLDTFVPRTTVDYPWYLPSVLSAGCYRVTLDLRLGRNGARLATYDGTLRVGKAALPIRRATRTAGAGAGVPGWLVAVAAVAALLLLGALVLLIRSRVERRRRIIRRRVERRRLLSSLAAGQNGEVREHQETGCDRDTEVRDESLTGGRSPRPAR